MGKYTQFNEHIELLKKDENYIQYFRAFAVENSNYNPKYVKEVLEYVIELTKEWNYKVAEHWCLIYIGWCENFVNNFLKAAKIHLIANEFFEKEQNVEGIIATCNALLSDYSNLGEIELAIKNGIRGIELANESKNEYDLIGLIVNTAETYAESEDFDEALVLIDRLKSYKHNIKISDEVAIMEILSKCALNSGKMDEAYYYCTEALEIIEKSNDIVDKEELMGIRAEINYMAGNHEEAIREFEEIIKITEKNNDSYFKIKTAIRWAKCYYDDNQYQLAKEKLFMAINDEQLTDFIKMRVKVYDLLKNIYSKMGEYEKAFKAFEKYDEYKKEANINHTNLLLANLKYKSATEEAKTYKSLYKKIDLISEVGRKITSSLVLKESIALICNEINKLVDTDILGIALYNEQKNMLIYEFYIENGKELKHHQTSLDKNSSFGVYCFKNKKEILINDIVNEYWKYVKELDVSKEKLEENPASIIYLPILMKDIPIAVLTVQSNKKNAYTKHDVSGLRILTPYIAIAIENGKLFDEVNYFANNDTLTGISNRNRIIKEGEHMLENRNQKVKDHSIIMMDIDYFKQINDTYGHSVGDVVLKDVVAIAKEQIKDYGTIGRYGGEEFLIILPNYDLNNANKIAESIRKAIEQYNYPITKAKYGKVTVSLGIYQFTKSDESLIEGLKKADKALYKAKAMGKNRSVNYIA